ncbi:MAG: tetratricopeptide repeat protein, partial [Gemmatimonadota bacterium]|nr:tetratricopeptide repeat protein [Gemmatimonadota bacterium]
AVPCPEWTGGPLHGETVLLTAEQGAGDLLQFIRYVPRVKAAGAGRVLVEAQRGLASLVAGAPGTDGVVLTDAPTPPCDLHVPIVSLPRLFGTRVDTIPSEVPYLSATARPVADLVRAAPGLRVGFVWSGNPRQNRNHMRSVPCDALLDALNLPGLSLFSLQVGGTVHSAFGEAVQAGRVTDLAPHLRDFADTAAAVAACDVVVSVCTSVAHLAGALGRPTFTLLAAVADWRWLMDREDSPWYPTMRLFRQAALDDWSAPLAALRVALGEALRARGAEVGVKPAGGAENANPEHATARGPISSPLPSVEAVRGAASGGSAGALFQRATALHAAGRADLALAAYDDVLRAVPAHAEALSNSAALLAQRGDTAEAERRFRAAVAANPRYTQAHHNLGLLLRGLGDGDGALAAFAQAAALAPQRVALWLDYANCATEFVHHDTALAAYDRALALEPQNATVMADRALALRGLMRRDEGIAACRAALRLDPRNAAAHANLALLLKEVRQWKEAEAAFHAGLAAVPNHPVMLANLSTLHLESGRGDDAMAVAEQLVTAHPNDPEGYNGRGCVHFERGTLDAARAEFERARVLDPANRNAEWNLTYLALLDGDLERGLRGFERRRSLNAFVFQAHERAGVEWDGSPLAGRTIFVHEEQGLGDVLQFVRYAEALKRRGAGRVIVETSADAARLVGTAPGVDEVVVRDQPAPRYDVFVPLMSLPYRCGTRLESIPGRTPYLRAEARAVSEVVRATPGALKVGLVWGGNPNHQRDRYRSVPFAALFSAVQSDDVALFSLQKGPHAADRPAWSEAAGLVDLAPHLQTLDDTASAIEALDLVITVDTAMAHLAGALGRPTWTLITRVPDWRWLRDRSDSPWYPSMRLFRQVVPDEWSRPLGEVRSALLALRSAPSGS